MKDATMNKTISTSHRGRPLRVAGLALALAAPLQACGPDRVVTGTVPNYDYRVTHPIVLANAPRSLDVFSVAGRLDAQEQAKVTEFAKAYSQRGQGQITVLVPTGGASATGARDALGDVRKALAAGGAKGYISVGSYAVTDPSLASPIRLSFSELQARLKKPCGEWPTDLASGSTIEGWNNNPYWNFGCSHQNMLAAQVADPRDLAAPRAESPVDVNMRMRAIQNVRKGQDPGTEWKVKNTSIGSVGGG